MASDQIEYCGECRFYAKCQKLAKEGRLVSCKANDQTNKKEL